MFTPVQPLTPRVARILRQRSLERRVIVITVTSPPTPAPEEPPKKFVPWT